MVPRMLCWFVGAGFSILLLALGLSACSATPPPRWIEGGMPIALGNAHWLHHNGDVRLRADGTVLVDGSPLFMIDRAGRVYDMYAEPVAVLLPNGRLVGTDNTDGGEVGPISAALPGETYAWLSLRGSGRVILYQDDGAEVRGGRWTGCKGAMLQTCTLVTHLVLLREWQRRPRAYYRVGVVIRD